MFQLPKKIAIVLLAIFFELPVMGNFVFAENLAFDCQVNLVEVKCQQLSKDECRKLLEQCEKYYQGESDKVSADMSKTDAEKKTLKSKITGLSKKIKDLDAQISKNTMVITDLRIQIDDTEDSISKTIQNISDSTMKLKNILSTMNQEDEKPIIEIMLSEDDFSSFFNNLSALDTLGNKGKEYLQEIKKLKISLEEQKNSLDSEKTDLEKMVQIADLQKQENSKVKKDQESYLKMTEQQYQQQLSQKTAIEKNASAIRARLFELVGVSKAPTFGEAYEMAKYVGGATGIRPAFLLAVLQQESALGKNVGQCVLTDSVTGAGKKINTGVAMKNVMKPSRDVSPFLLIVSALGKDAYTTPVSCPIASVGGYGGAMGPAQFIPSTWSLFAPKIQAILGKPGDPWNIRDAFLAAGLYLTERGCASKLYNDEWKSAMAYFSGSTKSNPKYNFYANSVMNIAAGFEEDIRALNGK